MAAYPQNRITCHPHSASLFKQLVEERSRTTPTSRRGEQVGYLGRYLEKLGVKTLVLEDHYVDRNFVEEAGLYYSRCLAPPSSHCARIHAFACDLSDAELDAVLTGMATDGSSTPQELRDAYRGFVVVRPLPSAPIGRTMLASLGGDRCFHSMIDQTVHMAGLSFAVRALPFQQQDSAVAACASIAVWSALQRASRMDGRRGPTTPEITRAAAKHLVPDGRAFPSNGLRVEQICDAIRTFDCAPVVIPARDSSLFRIAVHVYLRSGIPVILGTNSHAVTLVGYRQAGTWIGRVGTLRSVRFHNGEYDKLYLHDDRLGPYARARFVDPSSVNDPPLRLAIDRPEGSGSEISPVTVAIVPLYPKLRTSAEELIEAFGVFHPAVARAQQLVGRSAEQIGIELFFEKAGDYQAGLNGSGIDPARLAAFQKAVALSRYVGVARWTLDGQPFVDTIWDTTDRIRSSAAGHEHVLGLVAHDPAAFPVIDAFARRINKPCA